MGYSVDLFELVIVVSYVLNQRILKWFPVCSCRQKQFVWGITSTVIYEFIILDSVNILLIRQTRNYPIDLRPDMNEIERFYLLGNRFILVQCFEAWMCPKTSDSSHLIHSTLNPALFNFSINFYTRYDIQFEFWKTWQLLNCLHLISYIRTLHNPSLILHRYWSDWIVKAWTALL